MVIDRFGKQSVRIFSHEGMTSIGFGVPQDRPNTLIYLIDHNSGEVAKTNWDGFRVGTTWVSIKKTSDAHRPIVDAVGGDEKALWGAYRYYFSKRFNSGLFHQPPPSA